MIERYNTKDIRHINEKNQEYIAKNNRMTEETIKEIEINEVKQIYMKNRTFEGAMCDFMRIIASNLIEIKYLIKDCEEK